MDRAQGGDHVAVCGVGLPTVSAPTVLKQRGDVLRYADDGMVQDPEFVLAVAVSHHANDCLMNDLGLFLAVSTLVGSLPLYNHDSLTEIPEVIVAAITLKSGFNLYAESCLKTNLVSSSPYSCSGGLSPGTFIAACWRTWCFSRL